MPDRFVECLRRITLAGAFLNAAGWSFADDPPYPPSHVVSGITWHWRTFGTFVRRSIVPVCMLPV